MDKENNWWEVLEVQETDYMHTFQLNLKEPKKKIKHQNHKEFGHIFQDKLIYEEQMKKIKQQIIFSGRTEGLVQ